ncbi:MAG: DUF1461 domain-containing protein [Paraperlucidibaca sp.]
MPFRYQTAWFAVLTGMLLLAMGMSWWLHAELNYGYALWYDWLDLRAQIAEFGPQNRYILGFDTITPEDQQAAFNAIVQAVHAGGAGLSEIHFTDVNGVSKALLREPEVVHLHDVAVLMQHLYEALVWIAASTALGLWLMRHRINEIRWRWQGGLLLLVLMLITIMLFAAGFEAVFYQLHRWIFPVGHQWFFYYEDSLMSTMMKAPDLFAGIGASLAIVGLAFFGLMITLLKRSDRKNRQ